MNHSVEKLVESIFYQEKIRFGLWYHSPEDCQMILDYYDKINESNKVWFARLSFLTMYYIARTDKFPPELSRLELRAIRMKKKKEKNDSPSDYSEENTGCY